MIHSKCVLQFGAGFVLLLAVETLGVAAEIRGGTTDLQLSAGNVTFDAKTNVSAVSVHGKSTALTGQARIRRVEGQLVVDTVSATLPIDSITTGMGLRDEHMRKYIFTTADGQTPALMFSGENMTCAAENGKEATCKFQGSLAIRGVQRPLNVTMKLIPEGGSNSYRVAGDGIVKLSDYGIERPSQFGVKCTDDVKIHIEFAGKESAGPAAGARASR